MSSGDPAPLATQNPAPIQRDVIPRAKNDFYDDLSAEVNNASENRSEERYLYPLINRILLKHAETITHASPSMKLSVQAQYPFKSKRGTEASPSKFTVNGVEFEAATEIPDFVRVFLEKGKKGADHVLVDFVEVKPLDTTEEDWNTPEARESAEDVIEASLFQLYRQAMSGFFHHPEWTCVYGILVVGVYFSLFRWKRQKGKKFEVCPPIEYDFKSFPAKRISAKKHQALVEILEAAIKECGSRRMPTILCWNQPMFHFDGEGERPSSLTSDVTITKEFLWALRQPFEEHARTKYRLSFLSAPGRKPWRINPHIRGRHAANVVRDILIDRPMSQLMEKYDILTHKSASTASQKRNEIRSFGLDHDYAPFGKASDAARPNPAPRATRSRRETRAANAAAPPALNVAPVESASARVGGPPNA